MGVITSSGIDVNDVILLVVAVLTAYNNFITRKNHRAINEVNRAVNQVDPEAPTLREAVEEVKDKVETPDPSTPPIGRAVEEIAHSLESSTARETDPKGQTK